MKFFFSLFMLLWGSATFLMAQSATIRGRVTDDQGLGLPGANVYFQESPVGNVTDVNGYYLLVNVKPGTNELVVSYLGYSTYTTTVEVEAGQTLVVNATLVPGVEFGEGVLVIGDRLRGQARAINQQRNNTHVTNIVSADQIGRFPDANIGDALKRVPGITMQYDQGEARDIIVRGMAPQLNSVTINGERIPSAEGDNRRIQMDLIPSDMIQTIEVNKAVLPNMDADAIGGSVNLVTRSVSSDRRFSGTAASGLNLLSEKPIWTGALVVSDRFFDDKLGVVVSGSYNNHQFGSDNIEAVWIDTDFGAVLDEFDIRKYVVQRVRRSGTVSLDYKINDHHQLYVATMANWRDDWENRYRMRVSRLGDAIEDGDFTQTSNGVFDVTNARVDFQTKGGLDSDRIKLARLEDQRMTNVTLGGEHLLSKLKMTWSVTMAKASEERPFERYISFRESGQSVLMDVSDPEKPLAILKQPDDSFSFGLNELTENYNYTEDKDLNGRLDFRLPYAENNFISFGGRFRMKDKYRDNNFFEYAPLDGSLSSLGSVPTQNESDPGFLAGEQYQVGTFPTAAFLGGLAFDNGALFEETDLPSEYAPANYTATENIYAGYIMAEHNFSEKLQAIAGIRYESTQIDYTGNIFDLDEETIIPDRRENQFGNFMPGVHLKYNLNRNTVLRAAWTNTLARPNYYDLVPFAEFSPEDQELVRGNPDLEPATAMNFDFMAEHYFSSIGLVSLGGFFKSIDNFIYTQTIQNYSDPQFGADLEFSTPRNGGTASVSGIEAAFQRQLWKGLGIYANYTFTHSETEGIEGREDDDLSLPGTAEHMINASLSYETKKLVARVSLNFTNGYLDELGGEAFEDRFYDQQTFLDINASYAVTPSLRLFMEGNNLTNQPLRYYQGIASRTMQAEYYNARFNFGLKFDFYGNDQ